MAYRSITGNAKTVVAENAARLGMPLTVKQEGTITGGTYTLAAPNMTHVVAGEQGEGMLCEFKGFTDKARETAWGDVV